MIKKDRVVFDTNIYLSAIIFGGKPRRLLLLAIEKRIQLIVSPAILLEVAQKLREKFRWSEKRVTFVVEAIADIAQVVNPKETVSVVKTDPSDNKIIEAALAGRARFVITGDRHLLKIGSYRGIQILSSGKYFEEKRPC